MVRDDVYFEDFLSRMKQLRVRSRVSIVAFASLIAAAALPLLMGRSLPVWLVVFFITLQCAVFAAGEVWRARYRKVEHELLEASFATGLENAYMRVEAVINVG